MTTSISIVNNYKLLEKISSGSFGSVYRGEHIRTKELVAIKIEAKSDEIKSLKNEAKIYQYLSGTECFPQLKMYGYDNENNINYLVMSLLGKSLEKVIEYYKAFNLKNTLILGVQIIKIIQTLHEKELLHRDLKPSNFLFCLRTNKLVLIDFGFAKRYINNGKHISYKKINSIIGSTNFVSLNIHNHSEPSRRDDLESCIYIILNMLLGRLEWFNKTDLNMIQSMKSNIVSLDDIDPTFKILLHYVRNMEFDEKPDYSYMIDLLNKLYKIKTI